jgi:uncharacterized membrane protein
MKGKINIFNKFNKKAILAFASSLLVLSIFSIALAATFNFSYSTSTSSGGSFGGGTTVTPGARIYQGPGVLTINCHPGQAKDFRELILNLVIGCVLSPLVYLIIGASVIVFLYGVFKFIRAEGDDKQAGREFIIWGIVGLFVMVSVWGLVSILSNTFNINNTSITVPN